MASRSNRQRKLERERVERRLALQAHRARRRRQIQAGAGAGVALLLVVLATTWLLGGFDPDPPEPVAEATCTWTPRDIATDPDLTDVGTPPPSGELRSGFEQLTIKTDQGDISVLVDLSKVACTAASLAFLGERNFFTDSTCHRLNTTAKVLTCGDPKGTGGGGPSYHFADEALPTEPVPVDPGLTPSGSAVASPGAATSYYAKGTMIMANSGANTNGSQFSFVYADGSDLPPSYTVVGSVTTGLEIIEIVAQAGAVDDQGQPVGDGKPATALTIQQLYLGTTPPDGSSTAPAATTAPAADPSASAATTAPAANPSASAS